jgi:hypothetical protein
MKLRVLLLEEIKGKKRKENEQWVYSSEIPFYAELLIGKLILRPDPDLSFMIPLVSHAHNRNHCIFSAMYGG